MFRSSRRRLYITRILGTLMLGTLLGTTTTSCNDATQSALLSGVRTTASALLDTFFDNIAAQDTFVPVTVKAIHSDI